MKATEAREIAEKSVYHLHYILEIIGQFARDGKRVLVTHKYNEDTIKALQELGYDIEEGECEIKIKW